MTETLRLIDDLSADPFGERLSRPFHTSKHILGGRFRFESDSEALMHSVDAAYDGLPSQLLPIVKPEFRIELRLQPRDAAPCTEPPAMRIDAGADLLCGVMDASNYVAIAPGQGSALVVISQDMLAHPYHLRYELLEFAVFILAARGLGLVPLHGACVGRDGRGVLILGASGAGKSTLALQSLLDGLDFLAEDAVMVLPELLLATGVPNYLHVMRDGLRWVDDEAAQRWIRNAPVIRRRSGVEKFEADLRLSGGRLASQPLTLVGVVFASSQWADDPDTLLHPVPADQLVDRLAADQAYAVGQPGWQRFTAQISRLGAYELRRGGHPRASVDALRRLLD